MKVSIEALFAARSALAWVSSQPLSPKLAFVIGGLIEEVAPIQKRTEEAMVALMKRYGATSETHDGQTYWVVPSGIENFDKFEAERRELLAEEVELRTRQIRLSELEACSGLQLRPADALALRWLISEE